jgi:quinol monooxygenase YgiN
VAPIRSPHPNPEEPRCFASRLFFHWIVIFPILKGKQSVFIDALETRRMSKAVGTMARIGLLVTLKAKSGQREALLERLEQHAETTLARERGCMNFDIFLPLESEDEIKMVEIYLSEDALEQHRASRHLAEFRAESAAWVADRNIVQCEMQVKRR